jgi:chromosome segregation ATPase
MTDEAPLTNADVQALRDGMEELRQSVAELREATTPKEKQEAREEVEEAKADLDALASKLGISRAALDAATADARKAERRAELSPIVDELIEAKLQALADEDDDEPPKDDAPPKEEKPPKVKDDAPKPPPTDDAPAVTHWSDKRMSEILR